MTTTLFDILKDDEPTPAVPAAPNIVLRDYQREAVDAVEQAWTEHQRALVVLPTGCGKTITFGSIADRCQDGRVMVLAHREELIHQAADKIEWMTGERPDIEMADYWADQGRSRRRVVVSSIQTQVSGKYGGRMTRFDPGDFSRLIIDEAHHSIADTYLSVINHYTQHDALKVLGVTATPDRGDESALGNVYETCAYDYEINDAVADGWLVPITQNSVTVDSLDFSKVSTSRGDLNGKQLAELMEDEHNLHEVAAPTIDIAGERKTLMFASSVWHAERLAEIFNRHRSGMARFVCGKTPKDERKKMFRDYAKGAFQILVNVGVATEGFDDPGIEVVAIARPTKSRSLYAQMVGRGTRVLPDVIEGNNAGGHWRIDDPDERRATIANSAKPNVEVIDFEGNSGQHKLVCVTDILGGKYDDDIVERATRKVQERQEGEGSKPIDVMTALEEAEEEVHDERQRQRDAEEARRKGIVGKAKYKSQRVDPFDVLDVEPPRERDWGDVRKPTDRMVDLLKRKGVDGAEDMTFAQARSLIDKIISRQDHGWCTYKQAKILRKFGYEPKGIRFEKAGELITAIAENGWRRPE